uniref:Uncharacterized protein n=1 Tax=Mucochytrium quahogii TaxID=96639 RepID=A0A7S2RYX2_9STRA|mmetsp:Transcript_4152/g.6090  ORF Transcript_4152/g.6090 Transcript_4152/m.6090 type:complete len:352 (+) Transcript_4152:145-1200(+)|eukprot:CAMPEP_0203758886 /NCGR_PEP_ID=MMETSP0098-20131031/11764_1 /ASSEMBLY_ACC=CAM_ASM_000208 /TAXON_ID=96639 /ORGANISM=" , Strain NY0313808BC1" /LENGTH=351 /DNA_ID=CAMNT_0050651543 /DNA_START=171 /DNA_END=1226 /DNA_ORIENTATION=-
MLSGTFARTSAKAIKQHCRIVQRGFAASGTEKTVIFPNEGQGVDYATNWAVNSLGVTVGNKNAFRNPSLDTVLSLAKGNPETQTVERKVEKSSLFTNVSIDEDVFADMRQAAEDSMEDSSENVFVVDALAGSNSAVGAKVRAVTDDASVALLLQTMLCTAPKRSAQAFAPQVKVVHSHVADASAPGPYCATHEGNVVARGAVDAKTLGKAIATAAACAVSGAETSSVVIKGSVVVDKKSGDSTLYVGAENAAKNGAINGDVLWSSHGLSRVWDATEVKKDAAPAGSVIEGGIAIAHVPTSSPNTLPHPTKVVVPGGLEAFGSVGSLVGGPESEVARFNGLVELSNAKVASK